MSALEPGLYRATVRGVPDVIVMADDTGDYTTISNGSWWSHEDVHITDARPLIVLDLTEDDARRLASYLEIAVERHPDQLGTVGRAVYTKVASQIEAQTKPARIPEPGLWGVVEAYATEGDTIRREWDHRRDGWWTPGYTVFPWDRLVDPTLIREGI